MSEIGLMLQKKSDWRYFCIMAIVAILSIIIIFASGCIQKSGSEDYYNQGIYYNNHYNQYDKALENFNKSAGLEPGNPRVWFARSVALYNLKRYDESLESLNTTLAIDPDYDGAGFMRGEILSAIAKTDETDSVYLTSENFTNTTSSKGVGSVSNLSVIPAGTSSPFHNTNTRTE